MNLLVESVFGLLGLYVLAGMTRLQDDFAITANTRGSASVSSIKE